MKKIDLKKENKTYFTASHKQVTMTMVPPSYYLTFSGKGDPNTSPLYQSAIEVLFSVSYAIKFLIKKGPMAIDYGVLPLEGLWWVENMTEFNIQNKSNWLWKAMIMQPNFVDQSMVSAAIEQVQKKKGFPQLEHLVFESLDEKIVAQILHKGPYSEEGPTIETLHQFIKEHDYTFNGHHHEIYLSDPRRCAARKTKNHY